MPRALSPAMKRELVALYRHQTGKLTQHHTVNLQLVKALVKRGLAEEQFGFELATSCRMPGAYPLTADGRIQAMAAFTDIHGGGASTH